jgi:O-antigen/teichoic acid export membrane protein
MQSMKFAYTSLIYTFLNLISIAFFLFYLNLGLNGVLISGLISTSFSILISFFFQREYYSGIFSPKYAHRILKFSIPLILSAVAVYFSLYLDRIIINKFLGLKDLAVFGVAFRFAALVGLATTGFSSALTPLIYNDPYSKTTKDSIGILFRHFSRASLIFLLFLTLFSSEILIFLTTPEYLEASVLIPIVTCSMIFSSVYVFFPGLTLAKETGKLALINVFSSILNLGLCLLFIEKFGVIGVAFSTLLSSFFGLVINVIYSNRYYYQSVISLLKDRFLLLIGFVLCAAIPYADLIFVNSLELGTLLPKAFLFSIFLIAYIILLRKGSFYSN